MIEEALGELNIEPITTNWIIRILKSTIIISEKEGKKVKRRATRYTPQGGVIIIRQKDLRKRGILVMAYADEVVIIVAKHLKQ